MAKYPIIPAGGYARPPAAAASATGRPGGKAARLLLHILLIVALVALSAAALFAQDTAADNQALRDAKARAAAAEQRSELLRQEASNASQAADRLVAQRAVLAAEIAAAGAQIDAANARIAIINRRQRQQRSQLGKASAPLLRLNSALQQMTRRPSALVIMQPGERRDYVHLRAVMATVEPEILRRTAALRQQIAIQKELQSQEKLALKSLGEAKIRLAARHDALAIMVSDSRNLAVNLTADAAAEFEQAIAQGENARDIIERIDVLRLGGERASALAQLPGPLLRAGAQRPAGRRSAPLYLLPDGGEVASGYHELNPTGYRERGIKLILKAGAPISAPAAGKIVFAGQYRSYGNIIIIEHGGGWSSLITNLDALLVARGAAVSQGTLLGRAPANDPQILIELRRNGRPMDIAALI